MLETIGVQGREAYGGAYANVLSAGIKRELAGSDPDAMARIVQRALTARRPRTR